MGLQNNVGPAISDQDLSTANGKALYQYSTGLVRLASLTNQATTEQLLPAGVLIQGGTAGQPLNIARYGQPQQVQVLLGTGGCSAKDKLKPEYSATAATAARFIVDNSPGVSDFTWCTALEAGAEGDFVYVAFDPIKQNAS